MKYIYFILFAILTSASSAYGNWTGLVTARVLNTTVAVAPNGELYNEVQLHTISGHEGWPCAQARVNIYDNRSRYLMNTHFTAETLAYFRQLLLAAQMSGNTVQVWVEQAGTNYCRLTGVKLLEN